MARDRGCFVERVLAVTIAAHGVQDVRPRLLGIELDVCRSMDRRGVVRRHHTVTFVFRQAVRSSAPAQRADGGMVNILGEEGVELLRRRQSRARIPRTHERSFDDLGGESRRLVTECGARLAGKDGMAPEEGAAQRVFVGKYRPG
jgi:hypothetical protein